MYDLGKALNDYADFQSDFTRKVWDSYNITMNSIWCNV